MKISREEFDAYWEKVMSQEVGAKILQRKREQGERLTLDCKHIRFTDVRAYCSKGRKLGESKDGFIITKVLFLGLTPQACLECPFFEFHGRPLPVLNVLDAKKRQTLLEKVREIEALDKNSTEAQVRAAISACIAEGIRMGMDRDQAIAICYAMAREKARGVPLPPREGEEA